MKQPRNQNALFVATKSSVSGKPGGVQLCTDEYRQTLKLAGWQLHEVLFESNLNFAARLKRRLYPKPYKNRISPTLTTRIAEEFHRLKCSTVFLNQCDILEIVEPLRNALPTAKLIFLSHGLESMDYLHTLRSRGYARPFAASTSAEQARLAYQLVAECQQRAFLDSTICLSNVETEIERWLGAKNLTWLPRAVKKDYLDWSPIEGRAGFVGTLDHPPNAEGLIHFLRELDRVNAEVSVRVIGGPIEVGQQLANQFPRVEYLGALGNEALRKEAQSWCCFLHPLFCYPRGASTKLAIGMSWGIPIVTATAGRRGYRWSEGGLIETPDVQSFTIAAIQVCNDSVLRQQAMHDVRRACESSPSVSEIARELQLFLESLDQSPPCR